MSYKSQVRIVRTDGKEFVFGGADWSLYKLEGLAAASYEIFSEKRGAGDGDIITGSRVAARTLKIKGRNRNTTDNAINRAAAVAFFNPKMDYKVYITYLGRTRWITAKVKSVNCPFRNIYTLQQIEVEMLCADPFLLSVDDFGRDIAAEMGRWGWPYMDHPTYGLIVSTYLFDRMVHVNYDGDTSAAPMMSIRMDNKVINPKVMVNGAYVRILQTLESGDEIKIETAPTPMVEINGENALNKVDRSSNFSGMRLQPGDNSIQFDADLGNNSMHVIVRYFKNYLGV